MRPPFRSSLKDSTPQVSAPVSSAMSWRSAMKLLREREESVKERNVGMQRCTSRRPASLPSGPPSTPSAQQEAGTDQDRNGMLQPLRPRPCTAQSDSGTHEVQHLSGTNTSPNKSRQGSTNSTSNSVVAGMPSIQTRKSGSGVKEGRGGAASSKPMCRSGGGGDNGPPACPRPCAPISPWITLAAQACPCVQQRRGRAFDLQFLLAQQQYAILTSIEQRKGDCNRLVRNPTGCAILGAAVHILLALCRNAAAASSKRHSIASTAFSAAGRRKRAAGPAIVGGSAPAPQNGPSST